MRIPDTGLKPKSLETAKYMFLSQVGVMEYPANSNRVKYNDWYYGAPVSGKDYPWCVTFVEYVLNELCGFNMYRTASCRALLDRYLAKAPQQVVYSDFKPGDIVIFDFSGKKTTTQHMGWVLSVSDDGKYINTIEGNTSSTGSQDNGGAVLQQKREIWKVMVGIRIGYK